MRNSTDPSEHRTRERLFMDHVERLLGSDRLRIDTTHGRRAANLLSARRQPSDHAVELRRLMGELNIPDRELESKMPVGQTNTIELSQKKWFFFTENVGRLQVVCLSPTRQLLQGQAPEPLTSGDVNRILTELSLRGTEAGPGANAAKTGAPVTVVLMSTSGFSLESRELATRTASRTLVMVEPNEAGGWSVAGPLETPDLAQAFDPEEADAKRKRIVSYLDAHRVEINNGGLSTDFVAAKTHLPLQMVEAELKSYASANTGLSARRIDGRLTLYREGSSISPEPTGVDMPFWEKVKGIFGREESREKKIARLNTEKTSLMQQRNQAYQEIEDVEKKEAELTGSFKDATALAQRRIATEIAQLRKGIERRQQALATIDKQINIIETGVHNLEMEQQLNPEKLQRLEKVAQASEHVDVGLATLDQLNEQADAVSIAGTEMSGSAADVMAELQAKFAKEQKATPSAAEPAKARVEPVREVDRPARESTAAANPVKERRGQAETG